MKFLEYMKQRQKHISETRELEQLVSRAYEFVDADCKVTVVYPKYADGNPEIFARTIRTNESLRVPNTKQKYCLAKVERIVSDWKDGTIASLPKEVDDTWS